MSKVWRYGDHVDTDVIIPARYLNISDFKELSEHAMEDIDTTFAPNVKPGDIMVAGRNFGCGSSREHAPIVIQQKGSPASLRKALPGSSTGMPSTSACRCWKSGKKPKRSRLGTRWKWILTREKSMW